MSSLKADRSTLYETDYYQWIETTLTQLRNQTYATVDWENLIDEIEDMSRRERRSLENNLIVILLHLLKWEHQPDHRTGSWAGSLVEHRRRLRKSLQESPSLKPYFESILAECYEAAIKQASAETSLPIETFPQPCPYKVNQILDDAFLPS